MAIPMARPRCIPIVGATISMESPTITPFLSAHQAGVRADAPIRADFVGDMLKPKHRQPGRTTSR